MNCVIRLKSLFDKFTLKAKALKKEIKALYLAYKRPDVPWYAKLFMALIIGYALSPVDLIPDFIPVIGYLDDLILIPLGISLAIKMVPSSVMEECRLQAEDVFKNGKPKNWVAGFVIILIWVFITCAIIIKVFNYR
ncbi:MAG TPA: YkvA family protein [Clostridia bacterium]